MSLWFLVQGVGLVVRSSCVHIHYDVADPEGSGLLLIPVWDTLQGFVFGFVSCMV
jgi:hypothetical protein